MTSIKAKKRFGQHFLHDKNILQKMVMAISPKKNDALIEIGPGLGALTTLLRPTVETLQAIEIDRDLIQQLKIKFLDDKNFILHESDVLKFNFSTLYQQQKLRIVGNLPYNISTPLIFHLFNSLEIIEDMYFLLQKEVVERLTAVPGSKQYGRLSIMSQYFCINEKLFPVGPNCFSPPPQVDSLFMRLLPRRDISPPAKNFGHFSNVVQQAFSMRRKTIANALKKYVTPTQLQQLNINPQSRPEQLSINDFVLISNLTADSLSLNDITP